MWPVGLVGGMKYERPVVEGGKVGAFYVLVCQLWNWRNGSKNNNVDETVFRFISVNQEFIS